MLIFGSVRCCQATSYDFRDSTPRMHIYGVHRLTHKKPDVPPVCVCVCVALISSPHMYEAALTLANVANAALNAAEASARRGGLSASS